MKVLLTGATGFVGKHVAARLAQDGHGVRCLVRGVDCEEAGYLTGLGAELAVGDILDVDSVAAAASGCEAVIHLVGIIFQRRGATFEQIHVQGTYNALAAASMGGAGHFLHMSALGTGPDAVSAYHRTKWAAEEAVRGSGIDYTIFRPSIIYGRGGEFIHMLASQIRVLPVVPVIGNGRYLMQPVAVTDVAACFSLALGSEKASGQVYELGGPEPLSYNEMVDVLCEVLGKRRFKLHIPLPLMKPVAWLSESIQSKPMLTVDQIRMLMKDNVCDIERMRKDLGVDPVSFADGLKFLRAD